MKPIVIADEIEMKVLVAAVETSYDMDRDFACEDLEYPERVKIIDQVANLAVMSCMIRSYTESRIKCLPHRFEVDLPVWQTVYRVISTHIHFLEDTMFDEPDTTENQTDNRDHLQRLIAAVRIQERMKHI